MTTMPASSESAIELQQHVIIKVLRAKLTRNFEKFGKMDPSAQVTWISSDGEKLDISRSPTAWNAHKDPVWDFTCHAHSYSSGDAVEIDVYEDNAVTASVLCGAARVDVDELVDGSANEFGVIRDLPLTKNGKSSGTVSIQAMLVVLEPGQTERGLEVTRTRVDEDLFETPVKRLGVSGGTAPFFELKLKNPGPKQSISHYIGKDLSRAQDELSFYEEIIQIKSQPGAQGLKALLDFTFEYAGVLTASEEGVPDTEPPKELLVLRNLRDGCAKLRMLDLKLGQRTAQGGWQGKSRFRAFRQSAIDGLTNSKTEGYRLEGFDGRPESLASMNESIGATPSTASLGSQKTLKKAGRFMLQSMAGAEIFMHFMDLHQCFDGSGKSLSEFFSPEELSELVLREIVSRLARLAVVCHKVSVPQKWIGSSVALGFDCGRLPARTESVKDLQSKVIVRIFDWGRSELNTIEKDSNRTEKEQADRRKFWENYCGGIDVLSWNAARAYLHRFGNSAGWKEVTFRIFDFDAMTADDFIGEATVPVEPTPVKTCPLNTKGITIHKKKRTISYSIEWCEMPQESHLKGSWKVFVGGAENLIAKDKSTHSSDPYCVVTAKSDDDKYCFELVTSVKPKTLCPVWNETMSLPVVRRSILSDALEHGGFGLGVGDLNNIFSSKMVVRGGALRSSLSKSAPESSGLQEWKRRLQESSIPEPSIPE